VPKETPYCIQWSHIKIQIPALREGVNRDYIVHFVCRNVTWTVGGGGGAVTCLATADVTYRHIRTVIWKTKGGFLYKVYCQHAPLHQFVILHASFIIVYSLLSIFCTFTCHSPVHIFSKSIEFVNE
jgi:hypothetical protein